MGSYNAIHVLLPFFCPAGCGSISDGWSPYSVGRNLRSAFGKLQRCPGWISLRLETGLVPTNDQNVKLLYQHRNTKEKDMKPIPVAF